MKKHVFTSQIKTFEVSLKIMLNSLAKILFLSSLKRE